MLNYTIVLIQNETAQERTHAGEVHSRQRVQEVVAHKTTNIINRNEKEKRQHGFAILWTNVPARHDCRKMARNESQQYEFEYELVVLRRCGAIVLLLRLELFLSKSIGFSMVLMQKETTLERVHHTGTIRSC